MFDIVEVKSGIDGFMIKMRDGRHLRCVHNNPQGGHLPDYAPHPAIVLKMEDGTGLLLPIIVCMYILLPILSSITCSKNKILIFISKVYIRYCINFCHFEICVCLYFQWKCRVFCSWQQCAMFQLYVSILPAPSPFLIELEFLYVGYFTIKI